MRDYDVIVIGAGSAGLVACKLANGLGKRVALIEKRRIGGDCTWYGCIPSKTLIKSAAVAHQASRMAEFGLGGENPVKFNTDKVMAHVRDVVTADAAGHPAESYEAEGINVIFGGAKFLDSHRIEVAGRTISAKKFIICTGSHAMIPPVEGLEDVGYLTNETVFDLEELPESLIILGAGPIGIELAAAFNRLGVKVTVLLRSGHILKKEDPEFSDRLLRILRDEGVEVLTNTKTKSFAKDGNAIVANIEDGEGTRSIEADVLLVAVGRRPNLEGLDLDKAGIECDDKGIKVDKHLRTTAKNIYAAGDVVAPFLFTHVAEYEAKVATTNACMPVPIMSADYDNVLWCTYTDPELARSGLTEDEARAKFGDEIKVYRWEHKDVDRAKTDLETKGVTKIICDSKGMILGIHILGHAAGELMHEVQLAKVLGKPFSVIAKMIHAYPSYSDAVRQPAKKCYIDLLREKPAVKFITSITGKKNRTKMIVLGIVLVVLAGLFIAFGDSLTLENIKGNADKLRGLVDDNYMVSVAVFVAVYVVAVAFNVPGALVLTLTAGFLYGVLAGTVYVNIGATVGATGAFIFARYIAGGSLQKKYAVRLAKFNAELDRNGAGYLLFMRFIPLFPFFLINLCAGLTNLKLRTFLWTTAVGILPGSLVFTYAGRQIREINSLGDIMTPQVYGAFILLGAFAVFPVIYKKVKEFKER